MKRKLKGFTLVELVIVIAIVIILSVVSVPIYRGYTKQAKMSEGYALLGAILSAQKTYYSQYGNFLQGLSSSSGAARTFTSNDEVLGINAGGNKYFTAFFYYCSYDNLKKQLTVYVAKPSELINDTNKNSMSLVYNVTKSVKIYDEVAAPEAD